MVNLSVHQTACPSLGQAVNLLTGWDLSADTKPDLCPPSVAPLRQYPVEVAHSAASNWQPLCVTFHPTITSLVERILPYRVQRRHLDSPNFNIAANLLIGAGQERQLQWMADRTGIRIVAGRRYLLFEMVRIDGRADHESIAQTGRRSFDRNVHLTDAWRTESARLRPGNIIRDQDQHDTVITTEQARRYVDAFYTFGTHFISAVEVGDILYQVVELQPDTADAVFHYWQQAGNGLPVSGAEVRPFGIFLGPAYAAQVGPIISLADDPQLPFSLGNGDWTDPLCSPGNSLLAVLRQDPDHTEEVLAQFFAATPTRIELSSLARFMQYYRAINFDRILFGALIQRWGDLVQLPVRRMPGMQQRLESNALQDAFSTRINDHILLYGDHPTAADWQSISAENTPVLGCHRLLALRDEYRSVTMRKTTLLTQIVDAGATASQAAFLQVAAADFDRPVLVCQKMMGVLFICGADGTKRDTVVDGFRFTNDTTEDSAGQPRVSICGDLHRLNPEQRTELLPCIQAALECTAVALAQPDPDQQRRREAAAFAEWIVDLLAGGPPKAELLPVRVLALYLARVAAVPADFRFSPGLLIANISSLAIQASVALQEYEAWGWANPQALSPLHPAAVLVHNKLLEKLNGLEEQVSQNYEKLLTAVQVAHQKALREATQTFQKSGALLLEKIKACAALFAPGAAMQSDKAIAGYMAEASSDVLPDPDFSTIGHLEATLNKLNASGASLLQKVLLPIEETGLADRQAVTDLRQSQEEFAAHGSRFMAVRNTCRRITLMLEYQAIIKAKRLTARPGNLELLIQLQRFRLLVTLGQVLQGQQAALHFAGLTAPDSVSAFELGPLGYLVAQHNTMLAARGTKTVSNPINTLVYG